MSSHRARAQRASCLSALSVILCLACLAPPALADDLGGGVGKLFAAGQKTTQSALESAREQYQQLQRASKSDPRVDYAFGLVLVHQHKYPEAMPLLAGYLKTRGSDVAAREIKIHALLLSREYSEFLKEASALADRFPKEHQAPADSKDQQTAKAQRAPSKESLTRAAKFLGATFAYLDLVRPDTADAEARQETRDQVRDRLGEDYAEAFAAGAASVGKRHEELKQAQSDKTEGEKAKAQAKADSARGAAATHEKNIDNLEKSMESIENDLAAIQPQLTMLQSQGLELQTRIGRLESRITEHEKNKNSNDGTYLKNLRKERDQLRSQYRDIERKVHQLTSRANGLMNQQSRAARNANKRDWLAKQEKYREQKAEAALKSADGKTARPPSGTLAALATYVPLDYEREKSRVLSWFAK